MKRKDFWIRVPSKDRKTFRIYERTGGKGGKPVEDTRIDAINTALKNGSLDLQSATLEIKRIKAELQKPFQNERYPISEINQDLFEKYWDIKYSRRKAKADSKRSARNFYLRALAAVGSLSLLTAKVDDLQNAIDQLEASKQRRVCNCINRLLAHLNRTDRLALAQKPDHEYRYLDEDDFKVLMRNVWDAKQRLVCNVAFYTGLRLGEVFGIREFSSDDSTVFVERQMLDDGQYGTTKNRKKRRAFVSPDGVKFVKEWLKIPTADRVALRKLEWSKIIRKASKQAFPKSPEKQITFHDLRHSYAIYCMSKGLSLTVVAASIGDGLSVAQEYYARFEKTSDLGHLAKRLWRAS